MNSYPRERTGNRVQEVKTSPRDTRIPEDESGSVERCVGGCRREISDHVIALNGQRIWLPGAPV
jgi:hypothetical protein